MTFEMYVFVVAFVMFFILLYPLVSILMSPKYTGMNKVKAFIIVLFTSWVGRIWLWCQEK